MDQETINAALSEVRSTPKQKFRNPHIARISCRHILGRPPDLWGTLTSSTLNYNNLLSKIGRTSSRVKTILCNRGIMEIKIVNTTPNSNQVITLNADSSDTIDSIKSKVKAREKKSVFQGALYYQGKALDTGYLTLSECGIEKDRSQLEYKPYLMISVKDAESKKSPIHHWLSAEDTILELKQALLQLYKQEHPDLPDEPKLRMSGHLGPPLEDHKALWEYHVQHKGVIYVENWAGLTAAPQPMQCPDEPPAAKSRSQTHDNTIFLQYWADAE